MGDFLQQLRIAIDGLTYPSESDEPFEVFTWPSTTTARFAVQTNAKSTAISEQTPGTFFDELLGDPQADRFRTLRDLLMANLEGLSVFRVHGGSELDLYQINCASASQWMGVKTISLET
jgi:hypothetical protein